MPTWPGTLPARPTYNFSMSLPKLHEDFESDIGPEKRRRRTSVGVEKMSTVWELDGTQVTTLETFYYTTLEGGTLSFDGTHPRTGAAAPVLWMGAPSVGAPKGDDHWDVSFVLSAQVP